MNPALAAFVRVFNLRMIAVVFYFCLLHALSRMLAWYDGEPEPLGLWFFSLAHFTRQTLLTGLSVLLMMALAESLLAGRMWPKWRRVALQVGSVTLGAVLGTVARMLVASWSFASDIHLMWGWFASTAALWTIFGGLAYAVLSVLRSEGQARDRLRQASRQSETLEAQRLEAQVSALNAQIEPHFLFNTLANVKRLYETAPERGRDMLVSLIAYLRAALPSMRRHESTLGQELELVRNYLTILQMRMGERLSFEITVEPGLLAAKLPPMVLPTLVENAIKHGLSPLPEGGRIEIVVTTQNWGEIAVEVRDNGRGFAASGGSGVGLANTRARLAALFGAEAALELETAQPRGVVARVRMPMRLQTAASVRAVAA